MIRFSEWVWMIRFSERVLMIRFSEWVRQPQNCNTQIQSLNDGHASSLQRCKITTTSPQNVSPRIMLIAREVVRVSREHVLCTEQMCELQILYERIGRCCR